MSLILLPYQILAVFMFYALIRSFVFKDETIWGYLNLPLIINNKYFVPAVLTDIVLILLSMVFPFVSVLRVVTIIVLSGFGVYWIAKSWQEGFIKTWFDDAKAYLNK